MTNNISLGLTGSWNDRDVASIAGVKPNILLRSASLVDLSKEGQQKLIELNVTDVIDLRSEREIRSDGIDKLPPSVNLHQLPVDTRDLSNLKGFAGNNITESIKALMAQPDAESVAAKYMIEMYQRMITLPESATCLADVLKVVTSAKGATLIHCTAGKDRTGVAVAIILGQLSVDSALIEQDYLYSNRALQSLKDSIGVGNDPSRFINSMLEVRSEYLNAALGEIEKQAGGLDGFLANHGFSNQDKQALLSKFGDGRL